jgi:hypothetical protein
MASAMWSARTIFLKKPRAMSAAPPLGWRAPSGARPREAREEILCTKDGPSDEVGIERNEQGEPKERVLRAGPTAIDVYHVGYDGESVK